MQHLTNGTSVSVVADSTPWLLLVVMLGESQCSAALRKIHAWDFRTRFMLFCCGNSYAMQVFEHQLQVHIESLFS
jgi:hypothetical protein